MTEQPDITNSLRGKYGHTLLMRGATRGDTRIVFLLSKREHDFSVVGNQGENVLYTIAGSNSDDVSLELFNSIDATQISGIINNREVEGDQDTPLHEATWSNKHKSTVWLLQHGADPSIEDYHGNRPGDYVKCDDETKRLVRSFRE